MKSGGKQAPQGCSWTLNYHKILAGRYLTAVVIPVGSSAEHKKELSVLT